MQHLARNRVYQVHCQSLLAALRSWSTARWSSDHQDHVGIQVLDLQAAVAQHLQPKAGLHCWSEQGSAQALLVQRVVCTYGLQLGAATAYLGM